MPSTRSSVARRRCSILGRPWISARSSRSLLIVFLLIPVIGAPVARGAARPGAARRSRRSRGTRVIALIHRQETVGFLGVPLFRFIDIEDSEAVLRVDPHDARRAADRPPPAHARRARPRERADRLRAARPSGEGDACSSRTTRCRAGRSSRSPPTRSGMDAAAVLGPVDPQLGDLPAASIVRVVASKSVGAHRRPHADHGRRRREGPPAHEAGRASRLIGDRMDEQRRRDARRGARGRPLHARRPDHGRRRRRRSACRSRSGFRTRRTRSWSLFPQSGRRRPSVQYVPLPPPPPDTPLGGFALESVGNPNHGFNA